MSLARSIANTNRARGGCRPAYTPNWTPPVQGHHQFSGLG